MIASMKTLRKYASMMLLICVLASFVTACSKKSETVFVDGAKITLPEMDGYFRLGKNYPKFNQLLALVERGDMDIVAVYIPDDQEETLERSGVASHYIIIGAVKGDNHTSITTKEEFNQLKTFMLEQREIAMSVARDSANNIVDEGSKIVGRKIASPDLSLLNDFANTEYSVGYVVTGQSQTSKDGKSTNKVIAAVAYSVFEGRTIFINVSKVGDQKDVAAVQSEAESVLSGLKNANQFGFREVDQ